MRKLSFRNVKFALPCLLSSGSFLWPTLLPLWDRNLPNDAGAGNQMAQMLEDLVLDDSNRLIRQRECSPRYGKLTGVLEFPKAVVWGRLTFLEHLPRVWPCSKLLMCSEA